MLLEVTINGQLPSAAYIVSEGMFWYLQSAFQRFAKETGIVIDIDGDAEIEDGCLLELFLTLEPIANEIRASSFESLDEVGLVEERNQITMYQTPRDEGLAMIEGVMALANEAYNEGKAMRIRGIEENQDGEQAAT